MPVGDGVVVVQTTIMLINPISWRRGRRSRSK